MSSTEGVNKGNAIQLPDRRIPKHCIADHVEQTHHIPAVEMYIAQCILGVDVEYSFKTVINHTWTESHQFSTVNSGGGSVLD